MRRLMLATAVVVSLVGLGGWAAGAAASGARPAAAGPAAPPGAVPTFRQGQPVTFTVPVTNAASTPCVVSAAGDGALAFTRVERDGSDVLPRIMSAFYDDGPPSGAEAARTVAAGATTELSMTSDAPDGGGQAGAGGQVLRTVSWSGGSRSLVDEWPVDVPGSYTITAVVQPPAVPDAGVPGCAGLAAPVTVRFAVAAGGRGGIARWWIAAGAAAVLALLVAAVLLWRHRRGRVAVAALVILLGGTALPAVTPQRASAIIDVPAGGTAKTVFNTCMANFGKMGGDVLSTLTGLDYTVTIRPTLRGEYPVTNRVDIVPGGHSSTVVWSWWSTDKLLGGGVPRDPCAELWHEFQHAYDDATGQLDQGWCDDTGISKADVRAVLAETRYRVKFGLPPRNDYNGNKMPSSEAVCKNPPTKDWGPVPGTLNDDCAADCATTNGDPHLTPFDGRMFDFQAAGEFDALVSRDDSLRVQVRQQPVPGSDSVSVNTAVAVRIGTDRVQVRQDGGGSDGFAVSVNGTPTAGDGPAGGTVLPGGGRLIRWESFGVPFVVAQWPDGTRVRIRSVGSWGLAFDTLLNPARRGHVSGLLGTDSGVPGTPVTTRDGRPFTDLSAPALYRVFGESWRIAQADSLFGYQPGQSTATFTDRTFPRRPVTAAALPNRAALEKLCRVMGLTRADVVDACVLDLALTGQAAFADSAVQTQTVLARTPDPGGAPAPAPSTGGGAGPGTPPTPPAPVVRPGGTLHDGDTVRTSIATAGQTDVYRLALGDATVFRLADVTGEAGAAGDSSLKVTLAGPDPADAPGFTVTSNYQYRVQKGGAYTLTVSRDGTDTGEYAFRLVTAKERRVPLTLGQPVTGSLDVPGRITLYSFDATVSAPVWLADQSGDCDLSVAVVEDSPAPNVYSPAGLCYGVPLATLEAGKHYLLIVWSAESRTGDYGFTATAAAAAAGGG